MIYVGIDIGAQGGIAVMNAEGRLLEGYKMPLKKNKKTSSRALLRILMNVKKKYEGQEIHVVYEKLNSFFGMAQAGIIGVSREAGVVESVIEIANLPYTDVAPRKWQNFMFNGEKQLYKKVKRGKIMVDKLDTKRMAEIKFLKLFPSYEHITELVKNTGSLRDGIIDAALMAVYGKRNSL